MLLAGVWSLVTSNHQYGVEQRQGASFDFLFMVAILNRSGGREGEREGPRCRKTEDN